MHLENICTRRTRFFDECKQEFIRHRRIIRRLELDEKLSGAQIIWIIKTDNCL